MAHFQPGIIERDGSQVGSELGIVWNRCASLQPFLCFAPNLSATVVVHLLADWVGAAVETDDQIVVALIEPPTTDVIDNACAKAGFVDDDGVWLLPLDPVMTRSPVKSVGFSWKVSRM